MYERPVRVCTSCDGEFIKEDEVEFINISEDIQGRDLMTFRCPKCGDTHKSYRLG